MMTVYICSVTSMLSPRGGTRWCADSVLNAMIPQTGAILSQTAQVLPLCSLPTLDGPGLLYGNYPLAIAKPKSIVKFPLFRELSWLMVFAKGLHVCHSARSINSLVKALGTFSRLPHNQQMSSLMQTIKGLQRTSCLPPVITASILHAQINCGVALRSALCSHDFCF